MMEFNKNKTKTSTDMPGPSSQSAQPSSSQILASPYSSNDLKKATRFLAEEVESGSLQYLKRRNLIQCTRGGHWHTPNKWEGEDGFMSHIVKEFPMPQKVPNEDDASHYEDDLYVVESAEESFDGVHGKMKNSAKGEKRKRTRENINSDFINPKIEQKFNGETVLISDDSDTIIVSDSDMSRSVNNMSDGVGFECDEEGECSTLSNHSDKDNSSCKNDSMKFQKTGHLASEGKDVKSTSDIVGDLNSLYGNGTESEISNSNVLFRLRKQIRKIGKSLRIVNKSFVKKSHGLSSGCRKLYFICLRIEKWSKELQHEKCNQNVRLNSEISSSKGSNPCSIKSLEKHLKAVYSKYETILSTQSEAIKKYNSTCNRGVCLVRCPNLDSR